MGQFKKSKQEIILLGSSNSLLLGHMPTKIPAKDYGTLNFNFTDTESYGLYNLGLFSGPDYNTFYSGLTKEDFMPSDEDFIEPVFRLLSEVIVNRQWNPVDFTKSNVLKASMKLLVGQTVTPDHNSDVADAMGAVKHTFWQTTTEQNGLTIPAGINGILRIDAKANPRIARQILSNPPGIHSNSVSVDISWDKSHPDMDTWEFYDKLGTFDEKGELIRKVCTGINRYYHTSLVNHGADPFAKLMDSEGKIALPTDAQNYSEEEPPTVDYYIMSYKDTNVEIINNTMAFNMKGHNEKVKNNKPKKENGMNEELAKFLATVCGLGLVNLAEGEKPTESQVTKAVQDLIAERDSFKTTNSTLSAQIETLKSEKTTLETENVSLKANAEIGKNYLTSLRAEVEANYKKLNGDKANEAILSMFAISTMEQLTALNKDYVENLEKKFPVTCKACGSKEVNRSSSVPDGEEQEVDTVTLNDMEIAKAIAAKKYKTNLTDK